MVKYRQPSRKPEASGAKRLVNHMMAQGWLCMKLGGGPNTIGWPDYYCYHFKHGHRWIETKAPGRKLRASQIKRFSRMQTAGDKIYVLHDERDYMKLFKEYDNWELFR